MAATMIGYAGDKQLVVKCLGYELSDSSIEIKVVQSLLIFLLKCVVNVVMLVVKQYVQYLLLTTTLKA